MNDIGQLIPALGSAGAVVVVVFFFLKHTAEQNKLHRDTLGEVVSRIEAIEEASRKTNERTVERLEAVAGESRSTHRATIEQLISLNRETVVATTSMSVKVDEALLSTSTRIDTLAQGVGSLRESIEKLSSHLDSDPDNLKVILPASAATPVTSTPTSR